MAVIEVEVIGVRFFSIYCNTQLSNPLATHDPALTRPATAGVSTRFWKYPKRVIRMFTSLRAVLR